MREILEKAWLAGSEHAAARPACLSTDEACRHGTVDTLMAEQAAGCRAPARPTWLPNIRAVSGPCPCGCGGTLRAILGVSALRGYVVHRTPTGIARLYVGPGEDAPAVEMTCNEWRDLLGLDV